MSGESVFARDVVLGTCTCTRVVLEYCFKVLVLEGLVLAAMWQVLFSNIQTACIDYD